MNPNPINQWISYPTSLSGSTVNLLPLEEQHLEELEAIAQDPRIWEHYPFDLSRSARFREVFRSAIPEREQGRQFPLVIANRQTGKLMGSTRFLDIQPQHKKLEIGFTWLHPNYWGTGVNLECKLLLLTYCFEKLGAARVQLKTDEQNLRSRKAIKKIGGKFEGILRQDILRDDGTYRSSAYFSILNYEWPQCKIRLSELLSKTSPKS